MFGGVILKGYGVVLGGGGARGGYEIGVWKALRELQIPIAAVTGTSVGALNGAMMVQGDYDIAEEIWMSVTADSIINMENEIASAVQDKKKSMSFINTIKFMITSKGLDITPLKELLLKVIDEEKIRRSETDLGIVTFSLTDFKPVQLFKRNIPEGKLVDYLLASACFPAFKIQEIDNKKFIDGGVYDNMPVSLIIRKNIKNIIAVDISTIELIRKIDSKGLNIINIKNSQDLGGILSFDSERSKRNMEIGYYDALKAFHKYDGKKYFIIPSKDYGLYRRVYINSINLEDLKKMYSFLGLSLYRKHSSANKLIVYKIIKTIEEYTCGKLNGTTIVPAMAEITAEQMGIPRLKAYTLNELIEKILEGYNSIKSSGDFAAYVKNVKEIVLNRNQRYYESQLKNIILEGKFLIFYNPDIDERDVKIKRFRRLIALTFPKVCVANLFISLMLSKRCTGDGTAQN